MTHENWVRDARQVAEGMSRKEMMDDITSLFGMEDERSIFFCEAASNNGFSDETIQKYYVEALTAPIYENEEG